MKGTGGLVLYLGYDGVLHHENCLWHPRRGAYLVAPERYSLFQHVPLLEQLLEPYPEVQIVLSTCWVRRYGCSATATAVDLGTHGVMAAQDIARVQALCVPRRGDR